MILCCWICNFGNTNVLLISILILKDTLWTRNLTLTTDAVTAAPQETWDPPQESHDQTPQMLLAGCSLAEPSLAEPSLAESSLAEPSLAESSLAEPSLAEPSRDQPAEDDWWI